MQPGARTGSVGCNMWLCSAPWPMGHGRERQVWWSLWKVKRPLSPLKKYREAAEVARASRAFVFLRLASRAVEANFRHYLRLMSNSALAFINCGDVEKMRLFCTFNTPDAGSPRWSQLLFWAPSAFLLYLKQHFEAFVPFYTWLSQICCCGFDCHSRVIFLKKRWRCCH